MPNESKLLQMSPKFWNFVTAVICKKSKPSIIKIACKHDA